MRFRAHTSKKGKKDQRGSAAEEAKWNIAFKLRFFSGEKKKIEINATEQKPGVFLLLALFQQLIDKAFFSC